MNYRFLNLFLIPFVAIGETYGEYDLLVFPTNKSQYGDDYGRKWVFIADDTERPHYVGLSDQIIDIANRMGNTVSDPIQYRLYTRFNINNYILLDQNAKSLNKTNVTLIPYAPVKLVTHGWMSSGDKNAVINIKNAYLKTHDYNVIAVDWSDTSEDVWYPTPASKTKSVGEQVGLFLDALNERYNITGDRIHLIGHSLGAHVMGNAALSSKLQVARITGLDPARPLFEVPYRPESLRLDPSDANFVDVIHTCSGILGVEQSVGHADFYPNSGAAPQPGCFGVQYIFEACSHSRAHFYFTESILNPEAFPAHQCKTWNDYLNKHCSLEITYMGENVDTNISGPFYLVTNPDQPYGRSYNMRTKL